MSDGILRREMSGDGVDLFEDKLSAGDFLQVGNFRKGGLSAWNVWRNVRGCVQCCTTFKVVLPITAGM